MAHGRIMVTVSHRLASLTNCDAILMLDQSRIVGPGPQSELLARWPTHQRLWHQQNRRLIAAQQRRRSRIRKGGALRPANHDSVQRW